jgi:NADH-quinone oxidoreductase subunit M
MPLYAFCFMLFTLANVGLPGTSGFIGEFLSLMGAFEVNTWVAALATTGIILSAAYALWLYRRIFFGILDRPALKNIKDLSWREVAMMTPLIVITILFGFWPNPILDVSAVSVESLMTHFKASLAAAEQARFALAP